MAVSFCCAIAQTHAQTHTHTYTHTLSLWRLPLNRMRLRCKQNTRWATRRWISIGPGTGCLTRQCARSFSTSAKRQRRPPSPTSQVQPLSCFAAASVIVVAAAAVFSLLRPSHHRTTAGSLSARRPHHHSLFAHHTRTHITHTHTHTHTQHNTTHTHPHNTRTHHLLLLSTHTRCAAGVSKDCVTAISPLTCRRPEDGRDAVPKGICLVPANRNQHVRQEHRPCKARWQPCRPHRVWTVCPVFGPSS